MNGDLLQIIQTITEIAGLATIFLLLWQIKNDLKWKKMNLSLDKVNLSLLEENKKIIKDFGIDMSVETLNDEDYKKLIDEQNSTILSKVQDILDMFENFSTLYNMNMLDKHFAFESYSENTIRYYSRFKKIIDFYRKKYDSFYYTNFEKCANRFIKQKQKELNTLPRNKLDFIKRSFLCTEF